MESAETGLRVAVNTVFGIYGLFDVATWAGIQRRSADFGQTLGVWGVPSGPYMVLPLFGPSNVRDTFGWGVDTNYDLWYGVHPVGLKYTGTALKLVDKRTSLLGLDKSLNEVALDKYSFIRDAYMQRRQAAIQGKNETKGSDGDDDYDKDQNSE